MKIINKIKCKIFGHDKVYLSDEKCEREGIFGGLFSPYRCLRCNFVSQRFKLIFKQMPKIKVPKDFETVLAEIESINDLGRSVYFEVVYYNDDQNLWESFAGSKTFDDGEKVLKWKYVDDCF